MSWKLTAGPSLKEPYHLNLAAAGVAGHSRLYPGQEITSAEIELPERLEDAVGKGLLILEEAKAAAQAESEA